MRFILVRTAAAPTPAYDELWFEWRATCAPEVDIFIWAVDRRHARDLIREKYENAYFSDMVLQ